MLWLPPDTQFYLAVEFIHRVPRWLFNLSPGYGFSYLGTTPVTQGTVQGSRCKDTCFPTNKKANNLCCKKLFLLSQKWLKPNSCFVFYARFSLRKTEGLNSSFFFLFWLLTFLLLRPKSPNNRKSPRSLSPWNFLIFFFFAFRLLLEGGRQPEHAWESDFFY